MSLFDTLINNLIKDTSSAGVDSAKSAVDVTGLANESQPKSYKKVSKSLVNNLVIPTIYPTTPAAAYDPSAMLDEQNFGYDTTINNGNTKTGTSDTEDTGGETAAPPKAAQNTEAEEARNKRLSVDDQAWAQIDAAYNDSFIPYQTYSPSTVKSTDAGGGIEYDPSLVWPELRDESIKYDPEGDLANWRIGQYGGGKRDYDWTDVASNIYNDYVNAYTAYHGTPDAPLTMPYSNLNDFTLNATADEFYDFAQYAKSLYGLYQGQDFIGEDGTIDYDKFVDWYNTKKAQNNLAQYVSDDGVINYNAIPASLYNDYTMLNDLVDYLNKEYYKDAISSDQANSTKKGMWANAVLGQRDLGRDILQDAHTLMGDEVGLGEYQEGQEFSARDRLPKKVWDFYDSADPNSFRAKIVEDLNRGEDSEIANSLKADLNGDGVVNEMSDDALNSLIDLGDWLHNYGFDRARVKK